MYFFIFEQSEWKEHTCLKDIQKILKHEKVGWSSLLQKVFKMLFTGMCLRHMNWQSHTDQINQIISKNRDWSVSPHSFCNSFNAA